MSCERETDRLEIIEMTRELTQERKKREMDRRLMDDFKQQVHSSYLLRGHSQSTWTEDRERGVSMTTEVSKLH